VLISLCKPLVLVQAREEEERSAEIAIIAESRVIMQLTVAAREESADLIEEVIAEVVLLTAVVGVDGEVEAALPVAMMVDQTS